MAIRIAIDAARLCSGELVVDGDEHTYLSRARRAAVGDEVVVFDGEGRRASARIVAMEDRRSILAVGAVELEPEPATRLTAVIPLIKGDRMDVCLEKLVEVGVDEVILYEAARAVVRLDAAKASERQRRYVAQVQAAARQSGRARAPTVIGPVPLAQALADAARGGVRWVADPGAETPLRWPTPRPTTAAILTGPEGGLAPDELALAITAGWIPVSLGNHVLRAETAPVIAIAHLRMLGD